MEIRPLTASEVGTLACGLALQEGWNPGVNDGSCFYQADPGGFLGGFIQGDPVGCISAVCYPEQFAFLGLYIVRSHFRGQGHGIRLWSSAISRMEGCNIGLDGVVAQQDNYRRSGFSLAHRNIRYAMVNPGTELPDHCRLAVNSDLPDLMRFDRMFFPSSRDAFLSHWLSRPGTVCISGYTSGSLSAYGVARPCYRGYKIGPLFALDPHSAFSTFRGLLSQLPVKAACFLDVPEPNRHALRIINHFNMKPEFETARMYTGPLPQVNWEGVYGITTFELG